MKSEIIQLIQSALNSLIENGSISSQAQDVFPHAERTKQKTHGDFASNVAMQLAKIEGASPRHIAQLIVDELPSSNILDKVELAGPGFINFFLVDGAQSLILKEIFQQKEEYGFIKVDQSKKITVEFISANPTGPLHVGHGRGAAYGDSLSRLLKAAGNNVTTEYYVNDAGRQMDIMAVSVWLRYLEEMGEEIEFPSNAYQGEYIKDIAAKLAINYEDELVLSAQDLFHDLPEDDELRIDAIINSVKKSLGEDKYQQLFKLTLDTQRDQIKEDLADFDVNFDQWFSEKSLHNDGSLEKAVNLLKDSGSLYEKDGALWFKSSELGDEKDRVIQRANGGFTYFASDIAYMINKVERGFEKLIYVWGADHHGYVARLKAAFKALGYDESMIEILLVQFAILYRNGEKASMSTRSGEFVTLEDLREEVGKDASRFFYCLRRPEQHMDFDLDLAKEESNENPVYYVQYAHARICSILRQAADKFNEMNIEEVDLSLFDSEIEHSTIAHLAKYPEMIETAANQYEPHQIAYYLKELASLFHSLYSSVRILDDSQSNDRLYSKLLLIDSVRQVFENGLELLGVRAPEHM